MAKKTSRPQYVKNIQVDKETKKTVVVDVPETEFLNQPIKEADFVEKKSNKALRKQIAAEKVFGIKKTDESISKRQKIFKNATTAVFIIFMVGVLVFTAYKDFFGGKQYPSLSTLKEIFSNGWLFLLLAILSLALSFLFKSLKISIMCKSMTKKAHFKTSVETAIIGTYYNNVTPLAVGGQPFEIYHLSKNGVKGGVASSIPIATFFLNQLAFVILGIASLILFKRNVLGAPQYLVDSFPAFYALAMIGLFCCIFVPSLVILFSLLPKVGAKLVYFIISIGTKLKIVRKPEETLQNTIKTVVHNSHCLKKLASRPLVFSLTFLLSFLENIANVSIAFFVLKAFGLNLDMPFITEWAIVLMICFILFASITFIPTPGNSGAADLSFFLLFETVLLPGLVFPAMITWRVLSFYSIIIIGFTFATLKKRASKKHENIKNANEDLEKETQTNIE